MTSAWHVNHTFDKDLSIEVVRTKRRKTASIKVIDDAVQAIVPDDLSDVRVKELIQKRTPWIRRKLREQSQAVTPKPKEYVCSESFTYLGRNYRLKVLRGTDREVKLKGGFLAARNTLIARRDASHVGT
jgi:predicted metal-dependent hydrolase